MNDLKTLDVAAGMGGMVGMGMMEEGVYIDSLVREARMMIVDRWGRSMQFMLRAGKMVLFTSFVR